MSARIERELDQVVSRRPPEWADPGGSTDPKAIDLSWEVALRGGLADRSHALMEQLRPRVEGLRERLKQANAAGEVLVAAERRRTLEALEPQLAYQEAIAKASAPARGRYGKALRRRLEAAEAAQAEAEAPLQELEVTRQTIARLAGLAEVEAPDVSGIQKGLTAKLATARKAADEARQAVAENAEAIGRLEGELAKLRARRVA